jgi:hypothetical protein
MMLMTLMITTLVSIYSTRDYLWRPQSSSDATTRKAALIDELSVNYQDPYFTKNVTDNLKSAGYAVDYYGPDGTTVGLFRDLATKNYDVVIVRSHTAGAQSIVTAEPYSQTAHDYEQITNQIGAGTVAGTNYFTITPLFIRQDMQGRLPDSIIVLMGCASLNVGNEMARAFLDRGARFVVGWNGGVTAAHTDLETMMFVESLAKGRTVPVAVNAASSPDPVYSSQLAYLEWSTVANERWTSMLANFATVIGLAALLLFGPLTVIAVPKILSGRR